MNKRDSYLRYSLLGIFTISILVIIFVHSQGKKDNEKWLQDYTSYQQATQLLVDGKYDEALPLLTSLEESHMESTIIKKYISLSLVNLGEYEKASLKMRNTLEINPFLSEDPIFMIQLAQILLLANHPVDAKTVLEKCQKLDNPQELPNYQEQVTELLQQL